MNNEEKIIELLTDIRELLHCSLAVQSSAPWPLPFEEQRKAERMKLHLAAVEKVRGKNK